MRQLLLRKLTFWGHSGMPFYGSILLPVPTLNPEYLWEVSGVAYFARFKKPNLFVIELETKNLCEVKMLSKNFSRFYFRDSEQ